MAIDDDPLLVKAKQLAEAPESVFIAAGRAAVETTVGAVLPFHIGEALTSLVGGLSQKRFNERAAELFRDFAEAVTALKDEIPNSAYYQSEEFEALLLEAVDQQRTNRFRQKRLMLASGLAKSGTALFVLKDNKEALIHALRTLSPDDIAFLAFAKEQRQVIPSDEARYIAARLEGVGLLESRLRTDNATSNRLRDASAAGENLGVSVLDMVEQLERVYCVSTFGEEFQAFLMSPQRSVPR